MSRQILQRRLTTEPLPSNDATTVTISNEQQSPGRKDSMITDQDEEYWNNIKHEKTSELTVSSYHFAKRPVLRATKLSRKHYLHEQMLDANFLNQRELKDLQNRYASNIWPNGTRFRLAVMNEHGTAAYIIEHPNGWSRDTNLTFSRTLNASDTRSTRRRPPAVAEIRVLIGKQDRADVGLHAVFTHPAYPTMIVEDFAGPRTVLHELGHVLGIQHEHQRWIGDIEFDTRMAKKYLEGISDPAGDILDKYEDTKIDPFEYDPDSIMHYCFDDFGEDAFVSAKPDQGNRLTNDHLTIKDRKLVAYLYPLPAGGYLSPKPTPCDASRLPRAQRQTVMLPHVWGSTCRVMLGLASFAWRPAHNGVNFQAQASGHCKRYFRLESWADDVNASLAYLAYLAVDPATANIQMRSAQTRLETAGLDPDTKHSVEMHRLRWDTSSKAKVITWIKDLRIPDTSVDFEVSVDYGMRLSYLSKRLAIHTRSTEGVRVDQDWIVINPDALNIDGGRVQWTNEEDSTMGFETFRPGLYPEWDHKVPQVMTAVEGLKYHRACKHQDNDKVSFKIGVVNVNSSGFKWEVQTCHRECFPSLRFSWIVVPKPVMEYFGLPKGDKRPKKYARSTTERQSKVVAEGDAVENEVLHDGIRELFEAAEDNGQSAVQITTDVAEIEEHISWD